MAKTPASKTAAPAANNSADKVPPTILTGTAVNVRKTNLGAKGVVYNFGLYIKSQDARDGQIINASAFNPVKAPSQGALVRIVGTETTEIWEKDGVKQTGQKIVTNGKGFVLLAGKGMGKKAA